MIMTWGFALPLNVLSALTVSAAVNPHRFRYHWKKWVLTAVRMTRIA